MILVILIVATVCLYLSFIMMKRSWLRTTLNTIFALIFVASLWLIHANDSNHFGMKQVTTEQTQVVYSASPASQLKLLLRQNVGTSGKHNVYIYKTSAKAKATHTKADYDVHNRVTTTTDNVAQLTTKRVEWVYRSSFDKLLFAGQNNHLLIKQTNTFAIPNGWYTLTTAQAKALAKQVKQLQKPDAATKAKMATALQAQLTAAVKKDPTMTKTQQAALLKKLTAQYQQQALAKLIAQIKATD